MNPTARITELLLELLNHQEVLVHQMNVLSQSMDNFRAAIKSIAEIEAIKQRIEESGNENKPTKQKRAPTGKFPTSP